MKGILIFSVLISLTYTCYGQNTAIDSLKTRIEQAKSDTARVNLKNEIVSKMGEVNLDSSITFGRKVILEAKKIGYKKGEAQALINVSKSQLRKGDFDTAKRNVNDAKVIVLALKDSTILSSVYGTQGMMYGMQGKYDSSSIYFKKAIAIAERNGNPQNLGRYYGGLAIAYQMQSDYPQALRYQQKSLQIAEGQNNISSQALTMLNMGNTYQKMSDTLRAEKTLLSAIELAKKAGAKNVEIYSYSNLASLYQDMKKWDQEYEYAIKATNLANELGDGGIEAASYSKAAIALANLKRYSEAITLIKKGMAIPEATNQPIVNSQLNEAMARTLMLQEKYREAIPYFKKCLEASSETDLYDPSVAAINAELAKCYENTGAYEKALSSFKKYAAIKDSITSRENIQKATEQTMTYEFEKKEQAQQIEQENKDALTNARQLALIIGLALTLILVFVAYRALRIKQKGNKKLRAQKEEVQKTLNKLKSTQTQLIQSEKMASLGQLTAGIAHEIQNPLNFVNNFSEVSTELIIEMKEELAKGNYENAAVIADDMKINLERINHHGKRADAIVKGMLQHSRSSSGTKQPTDLNALGDEYMRLAYHGLRAKDKAFNATMETDFDASLKKINIVPQDIGRVILNLLTNAFYAVNEKKKSPIPTGEIKNYDPTVWLSTKKGKDKIIISVKDNGNGIPQNVLDKIFQPFFTTKPTGQGTGLGLSLSYDIIKAQGGELKVETEEGVGTTFIIQLPK